jgi:uncharacterized protein YndB with AHSA1/START domain
MITRFCYVQGTFFPRSPEDVFRAIDDFSSMHKWMDRCIWMQRYSEGENQVGDPLRGVYRRATGIGALAGRVAARQPAEHLSCVYASRKFTFNFQFSLHRHGAGTYLIHTVEVTTKTLLARIAASWIKRTLFQHSSGSMVSLRRYLLSLDATR